MKKSSPIAIKFLPESPSKVQRSKHYHAGFCFSSRRHGLAHGCSVVASLYRNLPIRYAIFLVLVGLFLSLMTSTDRH